MTLKSNIQNRFENIHGANCYSLVDPKHNLRLYIGLDEAGNKALKYRGKFYIDKIKNTAFIKITQFQGNDFNTILFSLVNDTGASIFYRLCDDLIEITHHESNEQNAYRILVFITHFHL